MNKILKSLVVGGLGLMMLPGMVNASELVSFTECETVLNEELQKKITTCSFGYENTEHEDTGSFILEMDLNPTNENTTYELNLNEEYAVSAGDSDYADASLAIANIPAQTKAKLLDIVWSADASLDDSEAAGDIVTRISPTPSSETQITEGYGASSNDLIINNYSQEKTYNVTITWGSMEYNYVEKLDGTSEWQALINDEGTAQNYILVENFSNADMQAYIKFESSIEGVEANYISDYSYYENDEEHVNSDNLDYITMDAYVENENRYHSAVQWVVNLTGGTYDAVEDAYNNGNRKIGTITVMVGDASFGDIG